MAQKIRIKDIAKRAQVSTGTVDRVIHDRGNVSPEKRARVKAVMEELGYEPNIIARTLASNRATRIAILLPDPSVDPYWRLPERGVQKAWQSTMHYGVEVDIFFFSLFDQADFRAKAHQALDAQPEALLFPPVFLQAANEVLERCREAQLPVSLFNTELPGNGVLAYVGQHSYQSGVLAGKLLSFSIGNQGKVGVVNLSKEPANAKHLLDKERGLFDYFEQQGWGGSGRIVRAVFENFQDQSALRAFLLDLLKSEPLLSGLFVTNSRAYRILDVLPPEALRGIKIVGFDLLPENIAYLRQGRIQFLINQNPVEQGYIALMNLVNKLIFSKAVGKVQYLPLDIVVAENAQYYLDREEQYGLTV